MTTDQLERFHRTRPFVPFSIFIGDGREIRVDHPGMCGNGSTTQLPPDWRNLVQLKLWKFR